MKRRSWTQKDDTRVNEYAELIFDEVLDESENAAIWLNANPEGEIAIFVARNTPERRAVLVSALAEAMDQDPELLKDFATAVALSVHRLNDDGIGLSWDEIFDP